MPNLPAPPANSPFPRAPFRWAVEPKEGAISRYTMSQVTFQARVTGVTQVYPLFARAAILPFTATGIIISAVLASSITNPSATTPAAIMVHKDVGAVINANSAMNELATHVVEQLLGHSMRSGTSFIDDYAARYNSGEAVAIYVSSNAAACNLTGVVTIRYLVVS